MTRLLTSATDQIGASARRQDLLLNSNVVEGIDAWSRARVSWQWCNLPGYAGELTARTAPQTGPFPLPRDATEWWDVASVPVVTFNGQTCLVLSVQSGALLRLNSQRDLSDFTGEPIRDNRWRTIVQEGLGAPADEFLADNTETDPALSDTATVDCITFCKEHGILDYLQKCLAKAKELFSDVVSVSADYDSFPPDESDEVGHVAIKVDVRSDQDTAFRDYEKYADWMLDSIPLDASGFFVVTFSRV